MSEQPQPLHHPFGVAPYQMPRLAYWCLFLWSIVVFALGGILTINWVSDGYWPGYLSTNWPTTQGVIIRSELKPYSTRNGSTRYDFNVVYRYQVDQVEYDGRRIAFTERQIDSDKDSRERYLSANFPINKTCTVHYNSTNPREACLQPGGSLGFALTFATMSLAVFGYGFYSLVLACRGLQKTRQSIQQSI